MLFAVSPSVRLFRLAIRSRRFIRRQVVLRVLILAATLFAVSISASLAEAAQPSFAASQDFPTGPNPRSLATGDLNQDGKIDVAVVNVNSNTASVLLNTSNPGATTTSFSAKQDFVSGVSPVSIAVVDLNGDGKLDLAIANFNSNSVSLLLNTTTPGAATPSFAPKQDVKTDVGPIYLTAGDLNGDGKPDLAVVNLLSNNVSVFLNTTAPGAAAISFAPTRDFATGDGPLSVAVGDLNGDGKSDLTVVSFNFGIVSVLLNNTAVGALTPDFAVQQDFVTGDGPAFVTGVELNGDGKLDLVVTNFVSNTVSVLLNTTTIGAPTVTFAAKREFATGTGPIAVAVGDLNADGKLDLAVANFNSTSVSVLLNITASGSITPNFADSQNFITGDGPLFVKLADFNSDGKLDLAVANLNVSTLSVLVNTTEIGTATPGFAGKTDFDTGPNPRSVAAGDFNGDGKFDLTVANVGSNSVSVLLNSSAPGVATSNFSAKKDFVAGTDPVSVTVGDLNRDGKADLAVANISSNSVSVLLNTTEPGAATANFGPKQDLVTSDGPLSVALGDLNGDGKLDLVVASLFSTVSVFLNNTAPGAAMVSFAARQDFATGDGPRSVVVGDFNLDGKLDLAVANLNSNTVSVLLNTTMAGADAASFSAIHDFPTGFRPVSVTVGDLNGDGRLDLAVANVTNNTLSVLLNTTLPGASIPTFAGKKDFDTNFQPTSVTTGDLNGDGKLDLAIANSNSDNISVFVNVTATGAATPSFTNKQDFATDDGPISITSSDLNSDGKLDLAFVNFNFDTVSVLLNSPTITAVSGLTAQQGTAPGTLQIATVNNYGGNSKVDVKLISADPANGVMISNIINSDGKIMADVEASCDALGATFTLLASDGSSTVTDTLHIATTANTAPILSYQNQSVAFNGSININPTMGPSDNGIVSIIIKQSTSFTGRIAVDAATGVVSIGNAAPAGTHDITIRATDNCGATTDAIFTLTVGKADQTITFGALEDKRFGDPDFSVDATATSGLPVTFVAGGQCTLSGHTVHLASPGTCKITASQAGNNAFNQAPDVVQRFMIEGGALISLSLENYNVNESSGFVTITINRTGDPSIPVSVDYETQDQGSVNKCNALNTGLASSRCDFGFTLGTLRFAANETQKTFIVPITQDSYSEGPEVFTVNLSQPDSNGANLGSPSSATVTISDAFNPLPPNASDDTETFVRQQYRDFLNREADPAGLAFWTAQVNDCNPKPTCTDVRRINVSAAFFLSIEFQTTGNLVRSFYVAALDRPATNDMPAFAEFERDTQALQRGVIVDPNNNSWETVLNNNRDAFMRDFVTRAEFIGLYPTTDTPMQYVDKLYLHAGINPTAAERNSTIAEFANATTAADVGARGRALLAVTKNSAFQQREINRSFVQIQYLGYLRRNPNDAPDSNFAGFDFWLNKLNQFNGDFQAAEMVKAFISSEEYRKRFGP